MKKYFAICVMLLFVSVQVMAQDAKHSKPTTEITVADQTTQIIDKVFEKTTEAVTQLANALKVPAEHVYTVLIKQQTIKAYSTLISVTLALLFGLFLMYIAYAGNKKANDDYNKDNKKESYYRRYDYDDNWWVWSLAIGIGIAIIAFFVGMICIGDVISGIFNPEYGAIKDIIKAF